MTEIGKDFWSSTSWSPVLLLESLWTSSPAICSQTGSTRTVAQDHVQSGFECPHRWRHNKLSGQPVPVADHLRYLCVCVCIFFFEPELNVFQFVPESGSIYMTSSPCVFVHVVEIPLSPFFSRLDNLSSSVQEKHKCVQTIM